MARFAAVLSLVMAGLLPSATGQAVAQSNIVIVSTTTSTQDSRPARRADPAFEEQTATVKTISVGSGAAIALGQRGEADVMLAHAPDNERKYVGEGKMTNRHLVMYNDFIIVGPPADPAGIRGADALDALKRIAARPAVHQPGRQLGHAALELQLWKEAGIEPKGAWYIESGRAWADPPDRRPARAPTRSAIAPPTSRSRSACGCRSWPRRTARC